MSEPADRDIWRGQISMQVQGLELRLEALRVAQEQARLETHKDHESMRAHIDARAAELRMDMVERDKAFLAKHAALDNRLKPLERLYLILVGCVMTCLVAIPVVWMYALRFNRILDRLQQLLPPERLGGP